MAAFDFRCLKCQTVDEVFFFPGETVTDEIDCDCGGRAVKVWLKFPGYVGAHFKSGFDMQLGQHIESVQQRDAILKEKGLVAMGPDDYKRTEDTRHEKPPSLDPVKLKDAMDKALWQIKTQQIEPDPPPPPGEEYDPTVIEGVKHDYVN